MLVKATKPVIDRIHGQIEKLRDAECKREFGKTPADYLSEVSFGNDEHKVIELLFWGEHLSYRDKLPEEWFFKLEPGDTFTLMHPDCEIEYSHQVVFAAWGCNGKSINSDITSEAPAFVVKLAHKHLVPHRNQQGYHRKETHEVDNPDIHPAVRKAFDTTKAILCLAEKWQAVEQKVKTFLESTKSVNEAVKLWPELRTFLAVEDQQRLDKEGSTKKARESRIDEARKVLAEIDTQSIVADVVGIKLSAA
jgi:hypothetical protein